MHNWEIPLLSRQPTSCLLVGLRCGIVRGSHSFSHHPFNNITRDLLIINTSLNLSQLRILSFYLDHTLSPLFALCDWNALSPSIHPAPKAAPFKYLFKSLFLCPAFNSSAFSSPLHLLFCLFKVAHLWAEFVLFLFLHSPAIAGSQGGGRELWF